VIASAAPAVVTQKGGKKGTRGMDARRPALPSYAAANELLSGHTPWLFCLGGKGKKGGVNDRQPSSFFSQRDTAKESLKFRASQAGQRCGTPDDIARLERGGGGGSKKEEEKGGTGRPEASFYVKGIVKLSIERPLLPLPLLFPSFNKERKREGTPQGRVDLTGFVHCGRRGRKGGGNGRRFRLFVTFAGL